MNQPSSSARVTIRHVELSDGDEFLALMRKSRKLHHPWIFPPLSEAAFEHYMARMEGDDNEGLLVCERTYGRIVGVINLNNIVRGALLSASLGYYAGAPYSGQGLMSEGLELVKRHAFSNLLLHRLEANIQPENHRSIALVKRCGFTKEGYSPAFLFIDGAWRGHERWACVDGREGILPERRRGR
ncbi:MAG: GNAT family N-acetyltransferase [Gammaproteobacteria bacterium]|jgi:ribosomal-protein-alanine N-acetyltransferase